MKWFRLYTDILDDPKVKNLSDTQFRDFIYLMCLASEVEKEGTIPYSKEEIAWRLRRDVTSLCDALVTLTKCHIVTDNGDGIEFLAWKKRQYKSDSSAERTRRWRAKQKPVTSPKRHGDGHGDGLEQNRTDNKERIKKESRAIALPEFISEELWKEFLEHRKNLRKKMTPYAQKLMFKKLIWLKEQGYNPEHLLKDAIVKGWQDVYVPKDGAS